jgi:hypothetical protein
MRRWAERPPKQSGDSAHAVALLRPCRERPCRRAESSDELAPRKKNAHLSLPRREPYEAEIARPKPLSPLPPDRAAARRLDQLLPEPLPRVPERKARQRRQNRGSARALAKGR